MTQHHITDFREVMADLWRNGKAWKHQQVLHIVRNGTYAGLRQWNGGEVDGGQPAIVALDEYRQAEKRQPKKGNPRGNPTFGRRAACDVVDTAAGLGV